MGDVKLYTRRDLAKMASLGIVGTALAGRTSGVSIGILAARGASMTTRIINPNDNLIKVMNRTISGSIALNGATNVPDSFFESCNLLEEAYLPDCITFGNASFRYCRNLKKVVANNVTTCTGAYTFRNADNIEIIEMNSLTSVPESFIQEDHRWKRICINSAVNFLSTSFRYAYPTSDADVYLTSNTCDEIIAKGVPFGMGNYANVKFHGSDGYVAYIDGNWTKVLT